jgi:protein-disulfide isomerase
MNILMRCAGIVALIFGFCSCATDAGVGTDPRTIREAVGQVLEQEPELILEVLRRHRIEVYNIVRDGLEAKQEQDEALRIAEQIQNPLRPDLRGPRPALGPENAPVVIVAYSDFLCHFCGEAAHTLGQLMAGHPEMIRFYHKHHPLSDESNDAALYFEALARQDPQLAWRFYDFAFARQEEINDQGTPILEEIVRDTGADMVRLAQDLKDPALAERIRQDVAEAEGFGFDGTPAVIINGVGLPGARSLEQYEQIISRTTAAGNP